MHLGRGQMRVVLEDFVHRAPLFVLPGDEAHPDAGASQDRSPFARVNLLLDIRMRKVASRNFPRHFCTHLHRPF